MTTKTETVRDCFVAFVKASDKVAAAANKLNEQRVGAYSFMVGAGILAGTAAVFKSESESFMDAIRTNRDGMAVKLKCKTGKPGKDADAPVGYLVPSAFSAAKSHILNALERGVELSDSESGDPRPFTQIRKDVEALVQAEKVAALTGDDKVRHEIAVNLATLQERLAKLNGEALGYVAEAISEILAETRAPVIVAPAAAEEATEASEAA